MGKEIEKMLGDGYIIVDLKDVAERKIVGEKARISIGGLLDGVGKEYKGGTARVLLLDAKKPEQFKDEGGES